MDNEEQTFEIVERQPEIVEARTFQEEVERTISQLTELKADYARRITEIELFLGFAISEQDLAVRLARLEKFVGIGG